MIEDKYPSRKEEGLSQAITRLVDMYAVLFMLVRGMHRTQGGGGMGCRVTKALAEHL